MRLRERDKRLVYIFPFTGKDEDVYTFGKPIALHAAVYPCAVKTGTYPEALDRRAYGERVRDTKLMLCDGDAGLDVGMGVSLDGGAPKYRIVSLEVWSHTRALLEWIAEGRYA